MQKLFNLCKTLVKLQLVFLLCICAFTTVAHKHFISTVHLKCNMGCADATATDTNFRLILQIQQKLHSFKGAALWALIGQVQATRDAVDILQEIFLKALLHNKTKEKNVWLC